MCAAGTQGHCGTWGGACPDTSSAAHARILYRTAKTGGQGTLDPKDTTKQRTHLSLRLATPQAVLKLEQALAHGVGERNLAAVNEGHVAHAPRLHMGHMMGTEDQNQHTRGSHAHPFLGKTVHTYILYCQEMCCLKTWHGCHTARWANTHTEAIALQPKLSGPVRWQPLTDGSFQTPHPPTVCAPLHSPAYRHLCSSGMHSIDMTGAVHT